MKYLKSDEKYFDVFGHFLATYATKRILKKRYLWGKNLILDYLLTYLLLTVIIIKLLSNFLLIRTYLKLPV